MDVSHSTDTVNRIRQERILHNWRQKDLADELGTTVGTVKRWERGNQQPSAYFRIKLCALFGKSAEELGLVAVDNPSALPSADQDVSDVKQTCSSPEEGNGVWNVPYTRNPHFTGREDLLDHLDQRLSAERPEEPGSMMCQVELTQPQAIKGLGGIGKTQIAVEYAYRARKQNRYTHILWINASSEEAVMTSFVGLVRLLPTFSEQDETDQHKLAMAIKRWLEGYRTRWLLVFDNADDLSVIQPYVPQQGYGSVLLTTRAHAVGSFAVPLEVEMMGLMEGTQFLLHRAQHLDASDEEQNEASNIVIALDGFPLALDQAGAYIEETGCGFGEYLQLYEQHHAKLLARRGRQATHYPDSVVTTWELSFQKIEQAYPAATKLLQLCAYLSPDHIPEELFTKAAEHWPPILQQAVADQFTFNELLEALLAFSLIKRLTQEHLLSLHRLVQAVQLDRMNIGEQHKWAERVVCAVNTLFPKDPKDNVDTWPQCLRYLEQVQACDQLIQKYNLSFPEAADLLDRAGTFLRDHASYILAETLYQRALAIREQQFEPHYSDIVSNLNNLAVLYTQQGKYERAEPLYKQAISICERYLGINHADAARSLNNLAILYWNQGKYGLAEPLYQRALTIREQLLGANHPHTAKLLNNLANLYLLQGKYEKAEPLIKRAISIWEHHLGADHPTTAMGLNNVTELYRCQGKYKEAEPLIKRAIAIWEHHLGVDHPDTARGITSLAILYREQGEHAKAESLFLQGLTIRKKHLGEEHLDTIETLYELAELYREQGKYREAELLIKRVIANWEQNLGTHHLETARGITSLALLYQEQGKHREAEPLFLQALAIQEQTLTEHHTDLATTLFGLARLYEWQRNLKKATDLYQRALAIRTRVYGPYHPRTLEVSESLHDLR
ncbi:FxSxx-COOH system tetratricopeptide repeat protein [Dictyobacter kobayashii]|uniref:Tetratricopeptide repeat protein n=1 Tax=Dictyobacter kobayashii TaxID=2014872 RepID=A0A402ASW9_9CHLR|nr:FxSxx-COOH system tetratricopeptide repeat protein [Dictyobacter kobayashii]GCE22220.1 tetratricopeptide repeat protein [Dictyobacter kobayashii]